MPCGCSRSWRKRRRPMGLSRGLYLPLELAIEPSDRFSVWLAGRLAAARRRRIGRGGVKLRHRVEALVARNGAVVRRDCCR